ncbi:protein FAR1-RELATED SEQUENCE 6-like [Zingiber officinale]|uniref:protein FAR1-RELATED SEQUENCE 6-like n=1 Tax=Zingiber officinale TaxID=94328 RepID=UPI001C4DC5B9|nr:protein FAR1-RELATED SEQUENCE 6-like [Zingiber officinale]
MGDESFMGSVLDEKLDNYESVSGNNIANVEDDKTPVVGMKFKSYEEALDFYRQYARLMGFSARLKRTNYNKFGQYQSVEFICSRGGKGRTDDPSYLCRPTAKTNCPATILFKLRADGLLHVKKAILEHNHPMDPLKVELKKRRKKLPYSSPRHDENNGKIPIRRLKRFQSPSLKLVEDVSFGDKNLRNSGERGHLMLHDGDASAIYQFFTDMQKRFANFFYSMDLDEEGRLRNVFWADAVSRATYRFFGDVVLLDTSYLTCKFDIPLVLFLGVNNHGQLVLLGCGLVSDETFVTYFWLFKAWLACMSRQPDSFISDQCVAIKEAMAKAFPGVHHRLCLWQVMKRLPMHFRDQENCTSIKKALEKIVHDSYTTDELEKDWKRMIEDFGLEANEWLNWLYENRHSWIPSYLKGTFWAGLTCSERNACLSSFFDGFVYPETSLKQFLSIYEVALQSKYEKEAQAELESFNKNPNLVSKFYMERQLVDLYTYNKFKQFQDELKATIYCNVSLISEDGPTSTYGIKESLLLEDSNPTDYRDFKVIYKTHELEVQCCCGSFQTSGILCRHALSVLKLHQIYEIPPHYIIDRWKKYIRTLHPVSCPSDGLVGNNRWERYDNLARCCLQLLDNGVVSSGKYHLSLKLLKEVDKFLSNDNNLGNIDVKIVPTETRTIDDTEEVQVATSRAGNVQILSQMKPRGRPPKRKDDQETLLSRDHSGMNLSFPPVSNAGADIDVQESLTALAEVSPSDFSLGCHYGPQLNHTHQSNDQSRIPLGGIFQGQFDHQAVEGQPRTQWIYQQMLQETQTPNAPGWAG